MFSLSLRMKNLIDACSTVVDVDDIPLTTRGKILKTSDRRKIVKRLEAEILCLKDEVDTHHRPSSSLPSLCPGKLSTLPYLIMSSSLNSSSHLVFHFLHSFLKSINSNNKKHQQPLRSPPPSSTPSSLLIHHLQPPAPSPLFPISA